MANTTNYNLYVTSGGSDTFSDWRIAIAGESNSNMTKIDTALASKQDSIGATSGILKGNGAGGIGQASPVTDYQTPLTAGTDYATPASVSAISDKIPAEATSSNKLADKNYVNSSVENVAAYYITKNAAGDPFSTKAELNAATVFYSGGVTRTPTRNDYAIVLADESKTISATGENPTTRYIYNSGWEYQYIVNNSGLTAAQWATVNVTGLSTANGILKANGSGEVSVATVDPSPVSASTNLVSSGGVYTAISNITPATYTVSVPATSASWTDDTANSGYYTTTLTIQGLKASYNVNPVVDVVLSGTSSATDEEAIDAFGEMKVISTGTNSLTIKSTSIPSVSVTLKLNTWG